MFQPLPSVLGGTSLLWHWLQPCQLLVDILQKTNVFPPVAGAFLWQFCLRGRRVQDVLFQCFWQKRHSASSASWITATWGKQNCCLFEIQKREQDDLVHRRLMGTTEMCQSSPFLCTQPSSSLPSEGGLFGPTAPSHRRAAGEDELPTDG